MTKPAIRVLKQPPRPMGVSPVRGGVLQARLVAEQGPVATIPVTVEDRLDNLTASEREGWVEAPLEPTEAMVAAAVAGGVRSVPQGIINEDIARGVWGAMINARFDEPPLDTQSLFGASSSEIKAALTLYRKMKAPKRRKVKPA